MLSLPDGAEDTSKCKVVVVALTLTPFARGLTADNLMRKAFVNVKLMPICARESHHARPPVPVPTSLAASGVGHNVTASPKVT